MRFFMIESKVYQIWMVFRQYYLCVSMKRYAIGENRQILEGQSHFQYYSDHYHHILNI